MTSCLTIHRTIFAIILLEVLLIPIGQTPGFLSRAIGQQLRRGCKASGSMNDVEIHLATKARE